MLTMIRVFVTGLILGCLADVAAAQTNWVDKTVVPKRAGLRIYKPDVTGEQVEAAILNRITYKVLAENEGRLKVSDGRGESGWFDKSDAVLLDDAADYFTEQIRGEPENIQHFIFRAGVYSVKGDPDKAIKDLDKAIELKPDCAACYGNRGSAWRAKKEYGKAIDDYTGSMRIVGESPSALNNLAWLMATCPDPKYRDGKHAIEYATRALQIDEKNATFMDTLAAAFAAAGEFDDAVRWQERALQDPQFQNDEGARARLKLYRDKKSYSEK